MVGEIVIIMLLCLMFLYINFILREFHLEYKIDKRISEKLQRR